MADISWLTGNLATGGSLTYFFWRSAYLSMCFSSKSSLLMVGYEGERLIPYSAE